MCSKHIVVIGMVNKMGFIDFYHRNILNFKMCSKLIVVIGMVNKMGFIDFYHSKSWLNISSARLSEKSKISG